MRAFSALAAVVVLPATAVIAFAGCEAPPEEIHPPSTSDGGLVEHAADGAPRADGGGGFDGGAGDGGAAMMPFTIISVPDTQYYTQWYPQIFEAQTDWIIANKAALNIAFVLHEGDIVDFDPAVNQWENASRAMHSLDGVVPYFLAPGNHDYASAARDGMINAYFPVSGFDKWPWFGGVAEEGRIDNNFGIVTVEGSRWLVLALEFGPRDEILAWADAVLTTYKSLPAVMVTHAYLYNDGTRYDHVARPDQLWNPHAYPLESSNDGEEMWQKLVSKHDNLRFVLSGHVLPPDPSKNPDATGRLTSMRASGSHCHQILANYQTCSAGPCEQTMGGDGYLRIMRFEPANDRVTVRTYSPYLDRYKTDPANEFVLSGD